MIVAQESAKPLVTLDGGTPQPKTTAASVVSYYLALRDLRLTTTGTRQTLANAQSTRVVNIRSTATPGDIYDFFLHNSRIYHA